MILNRRPETMSGNMSHTRRSREDVAFVLCIRSRIHDLGIHDCATRQACNLF